MLTADLVNARRRGGELKITALDAKKRTRAAELASAYLELARESVGCAREDLDEAQSAVEVTAGERRLADGLRKLVEDRCEFDAEPEGSPIDLRREVFLAASAARQAGSFDRAEILGGVAAAHEMAPEALDAALYGDLRGAHVLRQVAWIDPVRLVGEYELAQTQAVLLRAVKVTVDVACASPGSYRALFRKLKFLRLLHRIEENEDGGYRIEIDGPFSLFESVTRYGLQLALALPALRECDAFSLRADVRWGPERAPLEFRLDGGREPGARGASSDAMPEEVAALAAALGAIDTPWRATPARAILELRGAGLCVPDLVFEHQGTGECIYLEVLGFWSRDAVWRRVELVEGGLADKILFAVSERLRVSEQVLGDDQPGALYVYKKVMSARAVLERIERLAASRSRPAGGAGA